MDNRKSTPQGVLFLFLLPGVPVQLLSLQSEIKSKGMVKSICSLLMGMVLFMFSACVEPDGKKVKQQKNPPFTTQTKDSGTEILVKSTNGNGNTSTVYIDTNGVITGIKTLAGNESRYIYFNANQSPASVFAYKESAQRTSNANVMNGYQFFFDSTGIFTHLEHYDAANEKIRMWFFRNSQLDSTCSVKGNFISEHDAHVACSKKVSGLCD
jgi:hypothetical protein